LVLPVLETLVLSPLVWNINFYPILEELNTGPVKVVGFADDACFLITGPVHTDLVDIIQPYLNKIVDWGTQAGLKFNENKTIAVMFTHKRTKLSKYKQIMVNNQKIKYSTDAKYLGITLDSKLTFRKHLNSKLAKSKRLKFAIKSCISNLKGASQGWPGAHPSVYAGVVIKYMPPVMPRYIGGAV
jgi:hypothetical protein